MLYSPSCGFVLADQLVLFSYFQKLKQCAHCHGFWCENSRKHKLNPDSLLILPIHKCRPALGRALDDARRSELTYQIFHRLLSETSICRTDQVQINMVDKQLQRMTQFKRSFNGCTTSE